MTKIIGISAFYHDSAVAYIKNGEVMYASQEERFSRVKHDHRFPFLALNNLFEIQQIFLLMISTILFFMRNLS